MAVDPTFSTNYLLGRGKALISDDKLAWYDLGNLGSFNYAIAVETLEHMQSREPLKTVDKDVTISITASSTLALETVHPENIRLFLMGDAVAEQSQSSSTAVENTGFVAAHGKWKYVSDDGSGIGNFTVVDKVSSVVVEKDTTTYVLGKDYILDERSGLIMTLSTGDITDEDTLTITYDVAARTRYKIAAGKKSKIETHFRFCGNPASGSIIDVAGKVSLYPDGELGLISDEWATFNINAKFIDDSSYEGLLEHYDYGEVA